MSPLQEYPHLFANGKFKCICSEEGDEIWRITGLNRRLGSGVTYLNIEDDTFYPVETPDKTCTLIARPISDMTDEEIREVYDSPTYSQDDCEQVREFLITRAGSGNMKLNIALKIADEGVYPFGQSHFEDGTVIDATKLQEAV